jgi:hypothetical protein
MTLLIVATILPVVVSTKEIKNEENIIPDFVKPSGKEKIPVNIDFAKTNLIPAYESLSRGSPNYEFIKEPKPIMCTFYDYMPGSYASHPIRIQTEHGDGHYLTFFAQASKSGTRRQYWAYADSSSNIQDWGVITSYETRQGYGSIGIHPATGNCIASWHENQDGDLYETALTFDDFDLSETPGLWQDPLTIPAGPGDLEYIWPYIYVGPSPSGQNSVRIYQVTNDYTNLPSGNPCEDVRIKYIDVQNVNGINLDSILNNGNWETKTVFTSWRDKECRPFQAFAIDYNNPGKVAFIGYCSWLAGDLGDMPVDEGAFVWESLDYGESWLTSNLHSDGPGSPIYYVQNPGHFPEAPDELEVSFGGGHNTAIYDSDGNLHWTYLQQYGYSDDTGSYYFPYYLPQAEMVWDGNSFIFHEVPELPGIDSLSGHSVPWDETNTYPVIAWSTYPSGTAALFHENMQKQAINVENNWMAQIWVDGTYHQLGKDGDPNYEDYVNHPMIYISISIDNGNTWLNPIKLTDILSDKFDFSEQVTVYPYVCDQIIDLGDNWGQIDMFYLNDHRFGSSVHSSSSNASGDITYCSFKIKFSDLLADTNGPYEAFEDEPIQFQGSAEGGDPPYSYLWDFGNGDTSTLKNPIYGYDEPGEYQVTLTVTDDSENTVEDTTTAIIHEKPCCFDVKIPSGFGFGLNAEVIEICDQSHSAIPWEFELTGGLFLIPISPLTGTASFSAGETKTLKSLLVFGLGSIQISFTISENCDPKSVNATIIGPFVIVG